MKEEKWGVALPDWSLLPDIGLYMDQVITLMERTFGPALGAGEITKSMVNNYVKVGLIKRPVGKKYDREHLAQLLMVGVLKQALSLEDIAKVLGLLCADGAAAGYARFCEGVRAIEGALGHCDWKQSVLGQMDSPEERAILAGVMAAVCAIRTRQMLAALEEECVNAEKE